MNKDLASVTGLLLKACPILKKNVSHNSWLEYLHTARFVVKKLNSEECDIAAKAAGCYTIEDLLQLVGHK